MRSAWEPFFLAQVGASAALTGLVFVALSINLSPIMAVRHLVGRAAEALILLVSPVIVGLALLAPFATSRAAAAWALVPALGTWVVVTRLLWRARASMGAERRAVEVGARVALTQLATLTPVVGAVVLLAGSSAGLALLAVGAVVSMLAGILDAWVLLVEILR